jgi:hypothetical protein
MIIISAGRLDALDSTCSVAMGVSTTMTLMAIPKYHLMFEIGDIVGTILGIVGIVIWLVIAYFKSNKIWLILVLLVRVQM